MKTLIILLTLATSSVLAADVSGTWKANFDTQRGLQKYTFALKQDGTNVSGKASAEVNGEKREFDLKEGKIEGDTVSFVEPLSIQGNEIRITYTGKVSDNEIRFTRRPGDFEPSEATAKRDTASAPAPPATGPGARRGGGRDDPGGLALAARKTETPTVRLAPKTKAALRDAAKRRHRSLANTLEVTILHWRSAVETMPSVRLRPERSDDRGPVAGG